MNVFISWSGDDSKAVAEILRSWLPLVVQTVRPWMSATDVFLGTRWTDSLAEQLSGSHVGIFCLSKLSLESDWILFEAGALAKSLEKSRVIPLLIDVPLAELPAPLSIFQSVSFSQDGIRRLTAALQTFDNESRIDETGLTTIFDRLGPLFEETLAKNRDRLQPVPQTTHPSTSDRAILDEVLALLKSGLRPRKADIIRALQGWRDRLAAESAKAREAWERFDAPTGRVADRLDDAADEIAKVILVIDGIRYFEP